MDIPDKSYDYLAPPLITRCEQEEEFIKIFFFGYNNEYYFDGYNVYVSDGSIVRTGVAGYKPVQVEGYPSTIPSYPVNPEDYEPEKERSVVLYQFNRKIGSENVPFPFENDVKYHIFLCSHHREMPDRKEGVSNKVEFTLKKDGTEDNNCSF